MFNSIVMLGNLTRDPEVRYTPNGTAICNFGIATNRKYGDKEETFFGEVTAWGKLGENCGQYLNKGSQCLVSGRLSTETWEKDGKKHSKTRITAEQIKFLGKPGKKEGHSGPDPTDNEEIPF